MKINKVDFNKLNNDDLNFYKNVYEKNITEFNNLIDKISSANESSPEWFTQTILSRNNYLSNIYFEYCKLEILKKKLKKNFINFIFVENNLQKKIIMENFFSSYKIQFFLNYKNKQKSRIFSNIKNFLFNLKFSFILFLNRSSKRKKNIINFKKFVMIENFLYKLSYDKKIYEDRYYGKLLRYLTFSQKKKIFFLFQNTNISNLKNNLKVIQKYNLNFVIISDFLKLSDYLNAFLRSQKKIFKFPKEITLNKLNLLSLFQDLYYFTHNDINSFNGILQFLFFKRLKLEISDYKIIKVIDWYENQAIDKGFNLGLNNFFPTVKSVGYQPLTVDFNFYSHLLPTKKELANNLTPNKIACMGMRSKEYLTQKFKLNKNILSTSPSLRYETLFGNFKKTKVRKIKNILIALPISYQDSEDILDKFKKLIIQNDFKNLQFFLNYHPMLNFEKLMKKNKNLSNNFKLYKKSFSKNYKDFDCLISNSSSICFEALALSIPVIIVENSKGITQNPISMVKKDIWKLVKNESDLKKALNDLLYKKNKNYYYKNSKFIKKKYFTKITQKNVIKFLGLN